MQKRKILSFILTLILVLSFSISAIAQPTSFFFTIGGEQQQSSIDQETFKQVFDYISFIYIDPVDQQKLYRGAIKGMLEVLDDPHTVYMDPLETKEFNSGVSGSFGGVGMVISRDGDYVIVQTPMEGFPAHKAGLLPGDRILEVNGQSIKKFTPNAAANLIRGEVGSTVELTIQRGTTGNIFKVNLTRALVEVNPVSFKMAEEGIGYIKITDFNEHAIGKVDEAYKALVKDGAKAIILDLRNNPGGYLNQALSIAEFFGPKGVLLKTVDRHGNINEHHGNKGTNRLPVAVLINRGSASASEIVAGALQDHGVAILVGEKTYGKGSVQTLATLPDGGSLKLTFQKYTTPSGAFIDGIGISPDYEVANPKPHNPKENLIPLFTDKELTLHSHGIEVLALQQHLYILGYDIGTVPTGVFSSWTLEALMEFQRDNKLAETGVATKEVYDLLKEKVDNVVVSAVEIEDLQYQKALELIRWVK